MLKAWLVGVGILFVLAEFSIWLKQFIMPLPIYILAGAFLAIASNYEQGLIALFRQPDPSTSEVLTQTATLINQTKDLTSSNSEMASLTEASDEQ
jgi:hypothetical protein